MRRAPPVRLGRADREQLIGLLRDRATRPRVAVRARIVLACAAGTPNRDVARSLRTSAGTVGLWRRRYLVQGLPGILRDSPRPGRPPAIPEATIQVILRSTLGRRPTQGSAWSTRSLARDVGVSKSSVQRIWKARGIDPRRAAETFPVAPSANFLERVTDLVGVYLDAPERAIAFATDERARASSLLRGERRVLSELERRNRGAEFRAFLQTVERETPRGLEVHLLADQRLNPLSPELERWLVRHPRVHVHFTPPDRFGHTLVDRLVSEFARGRPRARPVPTAARLQRSLREHFVRGRGTLAPFVWTATTPEIRGRSGRPLLTKETNGPGLPDRTEEAASQSSSRHRPSTSASGPPR